MPMVLTRFSSDSSALTFVSLPKIFSMAVESPAEASLKSRVPEASWSFYILTFPAASMFLSSSTREALKSSSPAFSN